jgi:hypothetical protein
MLLNFEGKKAQIIIFLLIRLNQNLYETLIWVTFYAQFFSSSFTMNKIKLKRPNLDELNVFLAAIKQTSYHF